MSHNCLPCFSVQMLLSAPGEDVNEMISNTQDPATLITYISVMKRYKNSDYSYDTVLFRYSKV